MPLSKFADYVSFNLRLSENTVKSYVLDIQLFLNFFSLEGRSLQDITLEDYRKYFSYRLLEKKCKASSNARAISAIKCFFKFLEKNGYVARSDASKLTFPKLPKLLPKAIEEEDLMNLFKNLEDGSDGSKWQKTRDIALIFLTYGLGLRVSEALSLNRRDIGKNMQFLKICGKGGKERFVPVIPAVMEKLFKYVSLSPVPLLPDYPLFITGKRDIKTHKPQRLSVRTFQKIIQKLRRQFSLPSFFTPHALRHSFATHIVENGGDIRNVQGLLGHSSLSTTQKYVKINSKALKNAYAKFHPSYL